MSAFVALIRGINVGGRNKVKMADLRQLFTAHGMNDVRTVLQSGNVVFRADETDLARLGARLEAALSEQFGFQAQILLREAEDFIAALDRHPFTVAQLEKGNHAMIVFLSALPNPEDVEALRENNKGRETIAHDGDALYIFYTDGVARSKLDNKRIERSLNVISSARNWNTCQRLLKLLNEVNA